MENSEMAALSVRVSELEKQLDEERLAIKPLLDFWNASKLIGKLLVIVGGIIMGTITVWSSMAEWLTKHLK